MKYPQRRLRRLRASEIHAGERIRVIAIEALHYDAGKTGPLYRLSARLEPAAMIVCQDGDRRVIGLAPVVPSLEDLETKVPGLRALLAAQDE